MSSVAPGGETFSRGGSDEQTDVSVPGLVLTPAQRSDVWIDFSAYQPGQQIDLLTADTFVEVSGMMGGDIATTLETAAGATVDQQLMAFLQFTAKAPIITYHVPYVGGFLQRTFKVRLGIDFQPQWIDLALLLPALFDEKSDVVKPLDFWIESFGLYAGNGRRSAMENTLMATPTQ